MLENQIQQLVNHHDLDEQSMTNAMHQIMTGKVNPEQITAFLVALRMKGETVIELTAAAKVMRELAAKITTTDEHTIDIVGTGGDQANTFNISTTCAFIVAGSGGRVAKHGNRSVSSQSGSADVLEAAGINLALTPQQVQQCIDNIGIGFLFAPVHHTAIKHAIAPRKAIKIRTIFNLLGPLTNPAQVKRHIIGVYDEKWLTPMAQVLQQLGSIHALVVHSKDGLDEISIAAETDVAELKDGKIITYTINPKDYKLYSNNLDDIKVHSPQQSLEMIQAVLQNQPGNPRSITLLNAGAAIYVAGLSKNIAQGIQKAQAALSAGKALEKLASLQQFSQTFINP